MPLGNDGIRPDATELRIRFACGATLGAIMGAGVALSQGTVSALMLGVAALAGGLVAGALARHFGNRFWVSLRNWLWPPWG